MLSQNTIVLEFNEHQKSDNAPLLNVKYRRLMDVKTIAKIHLQQSRGTYSISFFNVCNTVI